MTLPKHYPVTRVHARVTSIIQRCVISVIQLCAEVNKRGDRIGNEGGKPRLQIAANASWPRLHGPAIARQKTGVLMEIVTLVTLHQHNPVTRVRARVTSL